MLSQRPSEGSIDRCDPLVRSWVRQNSGGIHPVFPAFEANEFDRQRAHMRSSHNAQLDDLTLDFCNVIQHYQSSLPVQTGSRINIYGAHTWDEVIRAAKEAEAAYLNEANVHKKGAKGAARRIFRTIGDYSGTMKPWVNLLPNDSYFSVLSGGLKLVFGIASKRSERRIEILETFEALPSLVEKTQRYHELFPQNQLLRDRALGVYMDLLAMVEALIATLVDKRWRDRVKDSLKGPLADRDLDEKKRRFHLSMSQLDDQVHYLHMESSARTHSHIEGIMPVLDDMKPRVLHTEGLMMASNIMTQSIENKTTNLLTAAGHFESGMQRLQLDMNTQHLWTYKVNKQLAAHTQAMEMFSSLLQGYLNQADWRETNFLARLQNQEALTHRQTVGDLLAFQTGVKGLLQIDPETDSPSLPFVIQQAQFVDHEEQGRAQWVLQTNHFRQWLQNKSSDVLLVNGNSGEALARWSSVSLLSGMLGTNLSEQRSAYVLHFFCGAHNSSLNPINGPVGLMRSLNMQLLSRQQFDTGFVRFGQWFDGLKLHDLPTLNRLFRKLVSQLPDITVFCIVDGISLLETLRWRDDLIEVLQRLMQIVTDDSLDCTFKLLLTSPTVSRTAKNAIPRNATLTIPSGVGGGLLLTPRAVSRVATLSKRRSWG